MAIFKEGDRAKEEEPSGVHRTQKSTAEINAFIKTQNSAMK